MGLEKNTIGTSILGEIKYFRFCLLLWCMEFRKILSDSTLTEIFFSCYSTSMWLENNAIGTQIVRKKNPRLFPDILLTQKYFPWYRKPQTISGLPPTYIKILFKIGAKFPSPSPLSPPSLPSLHISDTNVWKRFQFQTEMSENWNIQNEMLNL